MKKLIIVGLLAASFACADEEPVKNSTAYVSLGLGPFPIPMPLFGVGGRFQDGHHGADVSLQGVSFGSSFSVLKENVDYLYYFKPNLASQFYAGFGASATEFFGGRKCESFLFPPISHWETVHK